MKKITKMGIDALKHEFPLLTASMQHSIKGGIGADCVVQSISIAAGRMGICLDEEAVYNQAISLIMADNPQWTRDQAEFSMVKSGLSDDLAVSLYRNVFSGYCNCGGSSGGCEENNPTAQSVIWYQVKDKKGNVVDYHAGVVTGKVNEKGEWEILSNLGVTDIDPALINFCTIVTDINTGYQCDGSGSGSSNSDSNGGSSCGSGSGSDGGSSGSGSW